MPIETSLEQAEIADSILDAPIVGNHADPNWAIDSAADERMQEEWPNEQADFADDGEEVAESEQPEEVDYTEAREAFRDQQELNEILDEAVSWQAQQQEQQAQPKYTEPTLAEYHQASTAIDQLTVNTGVANPEDAIGLCAGVDGQLLPGANPQAVDRVLSKAFWSACIDRHNNPEGNPEKYTFTSMHAANDFHGSLMRGYGQDPRMLQGDAMQTTNVVRGAMINVVQALDNLTAAGISLDQVPIDQINDPRAAEFYVNAFFKAYGQPPVSQKEALEIADGFTRYVMAKYQRGAEFVRQNPVQQEPSRPRRRSSRMSEEETHARKAFAGMFGGYR